jgi:hypothetical protein
MSYTSVTYPASRLIVTRFFGPIDYEDVLAWLDSAPLDALFSRQYDGIVDLRKARLTSFRVEKAQLLARHMIDRDFTQGSWAVLADRPAERALSTHYSKVAVQQHPIEVFSTVTAAAKFLRRDLAAAGILFS